MTNVEKYKLSKIAAYYAQDVQRDILTPGHKYPTSYATGEMKELYDAFRKKDLPNIKEETADVLYALQMIAAQRSGLNLPLLGAGPSVDKFKARKQVWHDIFKSQNGKFDNAYLSGGSNYKKPKKIVNALAQAGINIDEATAANLINEMGIDAEDETGYSSKERIAKLHPHVTQDAAFRKQELLKKLQEYEQEENKEKALADIYMANQWAELSGADLSDIKELPAKNDKALLNRLVQLETRLKDTGDLYTKK